MVESLWHNRNRLAAVITFFVLVATGVLLFVWPGLLRSDGSEKDSRTLLFAAVPPSPLPPAEVSPGCAEVLEPVRASMASAVYPIRFSLEDWSSLHALLAGQAQGCDGEEINRFVQQELMPWKERIPETFDRDQPVVLSDGCAARLGRVRELLAGLAAEPARQVEIEGLVAAAFDTNAPISVDASRVTSTTVLFAAEETAAQPGQQVGCSYAELDFFVYRELHPEYRRVGLLKAGEATPAGRAWVESLSGLQYPVTLTPVPTVPLTGEEACDQVLVEVNGIASGANRTDADLLRELGSKLAGSCSKQVVEEAMAVLFKIAEIKTPPPPTTVTVPFSTPVDENGNPIRDPNVVQPSSTLAAPFATIPPTTTTIPPTTTTIPPTTTTAPIGVPPAFDR